MVARFVLASLLGLLAMQSANAQNIVVNPGFETGSLAPWVTNDTQYTGVSGTNPTTPHSGSYQAYLGGVSPSDTLTQTLVTVPGQLYTLSYWLYSPGGSPTEFNAQINGTVIAGSDMVNPALAPYTQYTFTFTGQTTADTLGFLDYNSPSYFGLDDVSVTPTVVPEPASIGVCCLVAMGLVAKYCRRPQS